MGRKLGSHPHAKMTNILVLFGGSRVLPDGLAYDMKVTETCYMPLKMTGVVEFIP
jgi:hypothetical protein